MKKIILMTFVSLLSSLSFAGDCSLDQASFFWDIEMTNTPLVTELSDRTEDELDPELQKVLAKKGYSSSDAQRAAAPNFHPRSENEYDYYANGRYLAIAGSFEGSGEIVALIDLKTYFGSGKQQGLYSLIESLRPFLSEMDQKLLDNSEDFLQTSGFQTKGVVAVAGVKERLLFGLGQRKAMIETLTKLPSCQPQ